MATPAASKALSPPLLSPSSSSLSSSSEERLHKVEMVLKRLSIVLGYVLALVVCLALAVLYYVTVWPAKRVRKGFSSPDEILTNDWWGVHAGDDDIARGQRRPKEVDMRKGVELKTCYITVRDGVKLATDVWIPKKALLEKGTLPVVFHQARYYRSATLRWPVNLFVNGGKPLSFINHNFFTSFLSHDMILVSVDVRGTGASFGAHPGPWSPEERQDSVEVLDWIERQPWSNGKVGLWGLSYEGTSAFFTSLLRHPTVVSCCPMFFFWDVYEDVSHPGGVPMRHFSREWQGFNDYLDSGWVQSTGLLARVFLEGVSPVKTEDPWGFQIKQALLEHKGNWSLLKDDHIRYMDDKSVHIGRMVKSACASQALHELLAANGKTTAESPPHPTAAKKGPGRLELEKTLPFYLHVSGWLDASAHAAVMAFMTIPCRGAELLVGPWNHGGHQHVRPHHKSTYTRFDFLTEVSGFFVRHFGPPSDEVEVDEGTPQAAEEAVASPAAGEEDGSPKKSSANTSRNSNNNNKLDSSDERPSASSTADRSDGCDTAITPDSPPDSTTAITTSTTVVTSASPKMVEDDEEATMVEDDDVDVAVVEGAAKVDVVGKEEKEEKRLWTRARPRVRFFTHQEERWHEADTFPSSSHDKTDVFLNLGGNCTKRASSSTPVSSDCQVTGLRGSRVSTGRPLFTANLSDGGGVSSGAMAAGSSNVDHDDHCGGGGFEGGCTRGGGGGGRMEHGMGQWGGEEGGGSGGLARKLSARLVDLVLRRAPKLTLSQDLHDEEEMHELMVDIENDRDGEGVSRWAAMTSFRSLISYQMDGMRSNHLRFTSAPLKQDLEATGYPVVYLWVSAADDLPNLDIFAYLQAVRPRTGLSIYVTEGCFRAEHRKEAERRRPVDVRGLPGVPVHSYLRADALGMEKCRPVEVKFKLMPTSFRFLKGQRVRLSIGGADARHFHPITQIPSEDLELQKPRLAPAGDQGPADDSLGVSVRVKRGSVGGTGDDGAGVSVVETEVAGGGVGGDGDGECDGGCRVRRRVLRVHTGGVYASGVSLPVPRSERGGGGEGARENVSTSTTTGGFFAQNLWARRRSRSLSNADMSSNSRDNSAVHRRNNSEVRSRGAGGVDSCAGDELARIFED